MNKEDRAVRNKKYKLKKRYGLTLNDLNKMITDQRGVCAICRQPEIAVDHRAGKIKELAIDHNHTTGKIRGLLCSRCNTAIGLLRDSIELCRCVDYYLCQYKS